MTHRINTLFATFFHLGYFPFAPGSIASLAGAGICVLLHQHIVLYATVFGFITAVGFWVGGYVESVLKEKDPSCVVIDEVAGAMIAFFLLPMTPSVMVSAFFLFRAFDMFKIYPANVMEKIHGGAGIMMDDIVAGIYTNIVMHIAVRLAGIV